MKKDLLNTLKILTAAIILSFSISAVFAQWAPPTQAPPAGNVPVPVNVGNITQDKNGVFRANGLRSFVDLLVDGNVGIGTTNPTQALDVIGNIAATGTVCDSNGCIAPVAGVPSGAVMPFDLASCPSGWSSYNSAQNRTIVGSGGSYGRGSTGGASTVTLTVAEMPSHNHGVDAGSASFGPGDWYLGSANNNNDNWSEYTGGGQPHNNMPPYIALLYCVKN